MIYQHIEASWSFVNTALTLFFLFLSGKPQKAKIVPVEEGVFNATYVPADEGKCKVDVKYGGQNVPNRWRHFAKTETMILESFVINVMVIALFDLNWSEKASLNFNWY